jgi:hypothetical protein
MHLRAEYYAICHTCRLRHPCFSHAGYLDFLNRHQLHVTSFLQREALYARGADRLAAWHPRRLVQSAFGALGAWLLRQAVGEHWQVWHYDPNADVKQAFQGAQSMTVTNLHSLANSATAGWQSDNVSNTTNLYLDDLWQIKLDFANTAPANSKAALIFAYHTLDGGTTYTNPASGAEGTITLVDVTANPQVMPLLGVLPYTTQDEVAESRVMSMARTADGVLPERSGVAIINHSGAALAASANTVKHNGVYATVV